MKQYLLSVYGVEGDPPRSDEDITKADARIDMLNEELKVSGAWVFAGGLHPPASATVVRVENGEVLTIDGPFAETKDQLGGFWIIEAADLDVALDWSRKATVACGAPVEVRPFHDMSEA